MALFSIITVCYNAQEVIGNTIKSTLNQSFHDFEYVIVDGDSQDNTFPSIQKIVSAYVQRNIKIVSEPDKGIYDAMNKATRMASGTYCLFMNAGDTFHSDDVLEKVAEYISNDQPDICAGIACTEKGLWYPYKEAELSLYRLTRHASCHQATFIRRELLCKNPYDASLKIVADSKFFIEALILNNVSYLDIPICVCNYEEGGVSSDLTKNKLELNMVIKELFPPRLVRDLDILDVYYNPLYRILYPFVVSSFFNKAVMPLLIKVNDTKRRLSYILFRK